LRREIPPQLIINGRALNCSHLSYCDIRERTHAYGQALKRATGEGAADESTDLRTDQRRWWAGV
jgi:hypothetical protein